jgi:hypothetical protein
MRSNGLTAADYAPLAVLGQSVAADALLALRDAGVAAYAVHSDMDEDGRPDRATLFADRTALDRARAVVRELAPDAVVPSTAPQVDEVAWQQIVSGFSATAPEPLRLEPAAGDRDHAGDRDRADHADHADRADHRDSPPDEQAPPTEPHPLVRDDDHFVPEPPPPSPHLDLVSRLAWSGVFGGPLLLLAAALVSWTPPGFVMMLCVLGFVGGMTTLVVRMKDHPPHDDGPDDGAVV